MGGAATFGAAFAKAQQAVGQRLPEKGTAFISVNNDDKPNVLPIARNLAELGFRIVATRGTAAYLRAHGIPVEVVFKVNEGRPNVVDHILNNQVQLIVNTPLGRESFFDDRAMRRVAMMHGIPVHHDLDGRVGGGRSDSRATRHRRSTCARFRTTTPRLPKRPSKRLTMPARASRTIRFCSRHWLAHGPACAAPRRLPAFALGAGICCRRVAFRRAFHPLCAARCRLARQRFRSAYSLRRP